MKSLDEKISDRIEELKTAAGVHYSEEDLILAALTDKQLDELEIIIGRHMPGPVPQGSQDWDRMADLLCQAMKRRKLLR